MRAPRLAGSRARPVTRAPRLAVAALLLFSLATGCAAQRRRGYGAPPGRAPKGEDYYKILGVPRDANDRQIKKAYRKLALKHHPDKAAESQKEKAKERFVKIANAYDVLSDPDKRRTYDQLGEEGIKAGASAGPGGPGAGGFGGFGGFGGGGGFQGAQFSQDDAFDMFENIFGHRGGARAGGGGGGPRFNFGGFGGGGGGGGGAPPQPTIERVPLELGPDGSYGISVSRTNRVTVIKPGSPAARAGRLRVGDVIYEVDGKPLGDQRASSALGGGRRRRVLGVLYEQPEPEPLAVRITKGADGLGIRVSAENEITQITKGGPAEKHGRLRIGDRVLEVNGRSTRGKRLSAVLGNDGGDIDLVVMPRVAVRHGTGGGRGAGAGARGFGQGARRAGGFPGGGTGGGGFAGARHAGTGGGGGFPQGMGGMGGGINLEDIMSGMGMGGGGAGTGRRGGGRSQQMPNMGSFGGL